MATLLGNTYVFPLPSGGCCVCIAPNNTATMGRGLLGGAGGCAAQSGCKNTVMGHRIANYGNACCIKNSTIVGYDTIQGFGNSAACNASCNNTIIGSKAGYDVRAGAAAPCGENNVLIGYTAGFQNGFGNSNIGIGDSALLSVGSAYGNIAIGKLALRGYGQSGIGTIAIGSKTYFGATCGSTGNIFIGHCSGRYAEGLSDGIVAIGYKTNNENTGKNRKTVAIGFDAQARSRGSISIGKGAKGFDCNAISNNIAITINCSPSAKYHTLLGNSSHARAYIAASWTDVSDQRDKTNIKSLSPNLGLPFIKKLNPVTFNWDKRDKYVEKCGFEWGQKDGTLVEDKENYGFIAQEIETAVNELNLRFDAISKSLPGLDATGTKNKTEDETIRTYGIKSLNLISPIVQSLKDIIEDLENTELRLESLKQ